LKYFDFSEHNSLGLG